MGQYHKVVNFDKQQYLYPHKLGDGLKLREMMNSSGGTMAALFALLASSNGRGGGDIDPDSDVHKVIGSWAGDRIGILGDYSEPNDINDGKDINAKKEYIALDDTYEDITDKVLPVVESACDVKIDKTSDGWRNKTAVS